MRHSSIVIGTISLAGALVSDRFFKWVVQDHFNRGVSDVTVMPLRFGFYPNAGIGFGIQLPIWLIVEAVGLIIIGLAIWLVRACHRIAPMVRWGVGLILIGAISNLFDRIWYGYVIDVFNFKDWSVFNVADIWIVTGVFIIIIEMMARKSQTQTGL